MRSFLLSGVLVLILLVVDRATVAVGMKDKGGSDGEEGGATPKGATPKRRWNPNFMKDDGKTPIFSPKSESRRGSMENLAGSSRNLAGSTRNLATFRRGSSKQRMASSTPNLAQSGQPLHDETAEAKGESRESETETDSGAAPEDSDVSADSRTDIVDAAADIVDQEAIDDVPQDEDAAFCRYSYGRFPYFHTKSFFRRVTNKMWRMVPKSERAAGVLRFVCNGNVLIKEGEQSESFPELVSDSLGEEGTKNLKRVVGFKDERTRRGEGKKCDLYVNPNDFHVGFPRVSFLKKWVNLMASSADETSGYRLSTKCSYVNRKMTST